MVSVPIADTGTGDRGGRMGEVFSAAGLKGRRKEGKTVLEAREEAKEPNRATKTARQADSQYW